MRVLFISISLVLAVNLHAMEGNFQQGKAVAEGRQGETLGKINKKDVEENLINFDGNHRIDQGELNNGFRHAQGTDGSKFVIDAHRERDLEKIDEKERYMTRAEEALKDPHKTLNEVESYEQLSDSYTIEYCDECPDEKFLVTARKEKKRYVYLDRPPYILASQRCENHGLLSVRVEITHEPDEAFREDGQFFNISHISTNAWGGAYIDETYSVNGTTVTLRKTVYQEGTPWIKPGCYLIPALQGNVVNSATLITKLLGGNQDESLSWGEIQNAYLYHRVVNDTGQHFWILDDKCQKYEKLCEEGLCEYYSMTEDPETDKYWKGKKVRGSWGQTVTYLCRASCKNTCKILEARGCEHISSECAEKTEDGKCLRWRRKFKCKDKVRVHGYKFSGQTAWCLGGDCVDSSYESDKDMIQALGYLSILEEARKEFDGTDKIQIFKGNPLACTRFPLSFKDCCRTMRGWGHDIGFGGCSNDDKILAKFRSEGKCIQVGTYCAEHVRVAFVKFCLRKKTVFCCFGSKFGKLLQEQGRQQLKLDFGSPEEPNCRGFTPDELTKIDFDKLDLTEIVEDVMSKFKPQKGEHFAKGGELERIRQNLPPNDVPADLDKKIDLQSRKLNQSLQENMKHMTSGVGK